MAKTLPKISVPAYLLFRHTLDERHEYLIDFWRKKTFFSRDPLEAKMLGYSWLTQKEAEVARVKILADSTAENLSIAQFLFTREQDGTWSYKRRS